MVERVCPLVAKNRRTRRKKPARKSTQSRATDPVLTKRRVGPRVHRPEATRGKWTSKILETLKAFVGLLPLVLGTCSGPTTIENGTTPHQHDVDEHHWREPSRELATCQCNCGNVTFQP